MSKIPKTIIIIILMCILFPINNVFANQNSNIIPCFVDLTWGETFNSVLQKYRLYKIPSYTNMRNVTVSQLQLDKPYIYDIRVLPTATVLFVNDKLYSISMTFSLYGNEIDYARFRKKLIDEFGEPDNTNISVAHYEVTNWNKEIFSISLTQSNLTFSNNELAEQLKQELDNMQGKNITDWNNYVH